MIIAVVLLISIGIGAGLAVLSRITTIRQERLRAQTEATRLVAEAKEEAEHLMEEAKLAASEAEDEIWSKHEKDLADLEVRVKALDEEYRKKRSQFDRTYSQDTR
jgi:F0F1-type ATP synthase membrane subunit b/b'